MLGVREMLDAGDDLPEDWGLTCTWEGTGNQFMKLPDPISLFGKVGRAGCWSCFAREGDRDLVGVFLRSDSHESGERKECILVLGGGALDPEGPQQFQGLADCCCSSGWPCLRSTANLSQDSQGEARVA